MIRKYMNELHKEVVQIKRKIDGGHLSYFGHRDYLNAFKYLVILKNGSYFWITLGTKYIPNIKKKDVAFIGKQISCTSLDDSWNKWIDYVDSDNGRTRYEWCDHWQLLANFEECALLKYKVSRFSELDTGAWD